MSGTQQSDGGNPMSEQHHILRNQLVEALKHASELNEYQAGLHRQIAELEHQVEALLDEKQKRVTSEAGQFFLEERIIHERAIGAARMKNSILYSVETAAPNLRD